MSCGSKVELLEEGFSEESRLWLKQARSRGDSELEASSR